MPESSMTFISVPSLEPRKPPAPVQDGETKKPRIASKSLGLPGKLI